MGARAARGSGATGRPRPKNADRDDRHHQRQDRRALGRARDQIAGRRHQPDAEQDRQRAERPTAPASRQRGARASPSSARRACRSRGRSGRRGRRRLPVDQAHHSVGVADELGSVRDQRASCARSQSLARRRRRPPRCAGRDPRSARRGSRAARRAGTRARARSAAARPATATAARRRRGSRSRRAARVMNSSAPASAAASRTRRVRGVRIAERGCSPRPCRAAASDAGAPTRCSRRQASMSQVERSTPADGDPPASGSSSPSSSAATVLLPAPLSPTSATVSPGASSRSKPVEHQPRARGVGERHALEPDGCVRRARRQPGPPGRHRAGASSSANIRSATASPSALAWYSAPSRRNGRYSSGASTSTVSPAWRPRPPPTSRTPAATATSATPSVAASSSTDPDRKLTRSVSIVVAGSARRPAPSAAPCALGAAEGAQRRQAPDDVEEVGREPPQRLPALARALLGVAADQPHEHRHERQREQHDQRRLPVDHRDPGDDQERHDRGEHDLRQVAREVALERLDPLYRDGRDLGAAGAVGARSAASAAAWRRAPGEARRGRSRRRGGRRSPSPTRTPPRHANASTSSAKSSHRRCSGTPSNARATIRASRRRLDQHRQRGARSRARCRPRAAAAPTSCGGAGAGPGRARASWTAV